MANKRVQKRREHIRAKVDIKIRIKTMMTHHEMNTVKLQKKQNKRSSNTTYMKFEFRDKKHRTIILHTSDNTMKL